MYLGGPDGPLGFVVGEDVQVGAGDKSQDEVFETAEAAGQAAGVFGGGGVPVEVGGQPGGGQFPVDTVAPSWSSSQSFATLALQG